MFEAKYLDWNQKKIKSIIDFYGPKFIYFKKILDLGCGHGDIGGALFRLGAEVTGVDARQDHIKMAQKKFPGIKFLTADVERGFPINKNFDIILDLGLLCHVKDYENHLREICKKTTHLVLETAVCDSIDDKLSININENKALIDHAINGVGSRPSVAAIERVLTECGMTFKRVDSNKLNSGSYVYDWYPSYNNSVDFNKRRMWFCVKNGSGIKIANTALAPQEIKKEEQKEIPNKEEAKEIPSPTVVEQKRDIVLSTELIEEDITKSKDFRVAVCFSGHLRTFIDNIDNFKKNLLDLYNCDVFISTWDSFGLSNRPLDKKIYTLQTNDYVYHISQKINVKKFYIEENDKQFTISSLMERKRVDHRDFNGMLSMFYKIQNCNELKIEYEKENNFTYNCVVRARPDLLLNSPIILPKNKNDYKYVYVPVNGDFGGLNDQLSFSSSKMMDIYSSLYQRINYYLTCGSVMNPEKLVKFNLDKNKIGIRKFDVKYLIIRSDGTYQDNYLLEKKLGFVK